MIFHETAIGQGESAIDLRQKEGYALKEDSSGKLTTVSAATDLPIGVVHMGADKGLPTNYTMTAYHGVVGVKLDATPGTVNNGTQLVTTATGTWKAKPATGACVVSAIARETGEAEQLLEATLCAPIVFTA